MDESEGFNVSTDIELDENEDVKPDWVEDETVPPGFKRRIFENNAMVSSKYPAVLSPDGLHFKTRQHALRVLIQKGADPEVIERMSSCLVYEGWETHQYLPHDWRYRKMIRDTNKLGVSILSEDANLFKSVKEATAYIDNNYDEETRIRFKSFLEITTVELRVEAYDWTEDDTVPPGWKIRISKGKTSKEYFLSPDGKMFPSRLLGLRHLIREQFPSDSINQMKLKLVQHELWQFNGKLPFGWMVKDIGNVFHLLTKEGEVFDSFSQAFEHINNNTDSFPDGTKEMLKELANDLTNSKRVENHVWVKDDTVPEGWKSRQVESKSVKQYFLSPDGIAFQTRFAAFQYMVNNYYPDYMILDMKQCLSYEKWMPHELLPQGWLCKEVKTDGSGFEYITENGTHFESFIRAYTYAENNISSTQDNLDNLKLFSQHIASERRKNNYEWEESKSLPMGWKIRKHVGKVNRDFLLSPSGQQFQSRKMALLFMFKNNYPTDDIEKMRVAMFDEGWESDKMLPDKWIFSRHNKHKVWVFYVS